MTDTPLLKIVQASHVGGNTLQLEFNDGRGGLADLTPLVENPRPAVFKNLRDPAFFSTFALQRGAVCWPGELDPAPEYLYYLTFRNDPALQDLFKTWGYSEDTQSGTQLHA